MKKSLQIIALYLATQFASIAVAMLLSNWSNLQGGRALETELLFNQPEMVGVAQFFAGIVLLSLLWSLRLTSEQFVRPRRFCKLKGWPSAIGGGLLLAVGLSMATGCLGLSDDGAAERFNAMRGNMFCLLLMVLVGPLVEEVVFRDGVLRSLRESGRGMWTALIASSLIFAICHGNWQQGVTAFVMGIALGMLYVRTADLRLCLPLHVANNALGLLLLRFPAIELDMEHWPVAAQAVAGGAFIVAGGVMLTRWWRS